MEVAAGQEVGGFFFTLIETRTYSVGGRVLTADGKPAHTVWIMSRRESANTYVFGMEASANTNLQGEFRVSGLLPGKHRIHARSGRNENPQMASAVVEVTDQDLEGLTLTLGAGAEIAGRIVTDRQDYDLDWRRIRLFMAPESSARQRFFRWGRRPRGRGFHFQGVETVRGSLSPDRLAPAGELLCLLRPRRGARRHRSPHRVEK